MNCDKCGKEMVKWLEGRGNYMIVHECPKCGRLNLKGYPPRSIEKWTSSKVRQLLGTEKKEGEE